jgi:hypothetical protein
MLANTYWFIQTSKKGFLYDCSCESCPCSFSSVFFFDNKSSKDPVPSIAEVATIFAHQVILTHIMKRSIARAEIAPIFFIYTPK